MKFKENRIISSDNIFKKTIKNNTFLYKNILKIKYIKNKNKIDKIRKGNIVMFHNGRVGSTVLADLLNQHTKIQWDGEIFVKKTTYNKHFKSAPLTYLKYKMYQNSNEFYGFELKSMPNQHLSKNILNSNFEEFLETTKNYNFNFFINIKRKNYLKQYVSLLRVRQKNIRHTDKNLKSEKITIDIENTNIGRYTANIIENFKILDDYYLMVEKKLENLPHLFLTYEEDILPNPQIAYEKICNFLKIQPEKTTVNLKRTNPFPLNQIIENYSEVEKALKGTKYEWMLNE